MGVLGEKRCYKTKARLYRDSNREVTLKWFVVPDGTPFLPVPSLWGGRPWRYFQEGPTQGPGELIETPLRWSNGVAPDEPASWNGPDDWWANGAPIAALTGPVPPPRPGVCVPAPCMPGGTGCDECPLVSPVWVMDRNPFYPNNPDQVVLAKRDECLWENDCTTTVVGCPTGTAAAWFVIMTTAIPGLTSGLIVQIKPSIFSSCC